MPITGGGFSMTGIAGQRGVAGVVDAESQANQSMDIVFDRWQEEVRAANAEQTAKQDSGEVLHSAERGSIAQDVQPSAVTEGNQVDPFFINGYPSNINADIAETQPIDFGMEQAMRNSEIKELLKRKHEISVNIIKAAIAKGLKSFDTDVGREIEEQKARHEACLQVKNRLIADIAQMEGLIDEMLVKKEQVFARGRELADLVAKAEEENKKVEEKLENDNLAM